MVTKTYECPSCGEIEHQCSINENELKKCPKCNGKVKRIFKPAHYIFKCDGFAGRGFD